jgi:hypothetical protein
VGGVAWETAECGNRGSLRRVLSHMRKIKTKHGVDAGGDSPTHKMALVRGDSMKWVEAIEGRAGASPAAGLLRGHAGHST